MKSLLTGRLVTIVVVIFFSTAAIGQTMPQQTKLLPALAPPGPEAASLGRYGTYEVNLSSGVPNISIPIFEVQVGELRLPISISYHAAGIKLADRATRVGLGWNLDAGGAITRKIQGKPDEQPNNYFAATPTSEFRVKTSSEINAFTEEGLDYLSRVDVREYDAEPDIFSYSFPGQSGRFLFNQKDSFKTFLIPFAPLEVSKTYYDSYTVKFAIKDEGGRKYLFNNVETTASGSGVGLPSNTCAAWKLSEMISANTQDSIHLKYSNEEITDQYENEYFVINDNVSGDGYYNYDFGFFGGETVNTSTSGQKLDSIMFPNGKIIFEDATDVRRLKFIKIYSRDPYSVSYSLIKVIQLFHGYFPDSDVNRIRLDSIQFQSFNNSPIQTYRFSYNTSITMPDRMAKVKDWWGYYNNRANFQQNTGSALIPTSIPKLKHTYSAPPSAPYDTWVGGTDTLARYPDPAYMQAYILQTISFPTGGYTQFEYETNQYLDEDSNPKYAGGLRVKSIKSFTHTGATPIVKTYKYGGGESGYGRANFFLEQSFFGNHQNCRWVDIGLNSGNQCRSQAYKTMHTYFANPTNDIEGSDGSPVFYAIVTEYEGDATSNIGKTIYQFSDKADAKTSLIGYGKPYFDSYQFVRGLATGKAIYRKSGTGGYTIVSEQKKKFQFYPYQWTTQGIGIVVKKITIDQGTGGTYNNIGLNYGISCHFFSDANNYMFSNYNIVSGDNKLVADTTITYDQNDATKSLSTITYYSYDDMTHLQGSQTQTTNSRNETITTTYTYPHNYTTAPYDSMTANHIYDKTVQETITNSVSGQLSQKTNNYSSFSGKNYLPANIQLKIKANNPEARALFNQYDLRGNILEMQKANDVKEVYLWGYDSQYPVAKIINTTYSVAQSYVNQSVLDKPLNDATLRSHLDSLRTIPNALVTTYTYRPLVGITSETDARGKTIYYEYDNFNRLTIVRDQDGKILKKIDYQYHTTNQQ